MLAVSRVTENSISSADGGIMGRRSGSRALRYSIWLRKQLVVGRLILLCHKLAR